MHYPSTLASPSKPSFMMVEPTPEQQRLVQQAKDYQRQRMESTGEVIATSEVCLVSVVAYIIVCIHLLCTLILCTLIMPSWAECRGIW